MCGIAGLVGDFVPGLAARMNRAQAHRGPDGEGTYESASEAACLAHVRLAILDLSDQAAQPMHSASGRFVLAFNGEIYNYQELRRDLQQSGCAFQSSGDTEVLLQGLEREGDGFLQRLRGIFAFALWDRHDRRLTLARDPLGIKPLYLAEPVPGAVIFASEIKALCAHPQVDRQPDFVALHQHLAFNHASGDRTALAGVRRLPPGAILKWDAHTRRSQVSQYTELEFGESSEKRHEEYVELLRERIETGVRRQLVSDVRVGAFLSGGLDSSIITALASEEQSPLECFTTSYASSDNRVDGAVEDIPFARQLARHLDVPLHEIKMTASIADRWPELIFHLDEPLADPAAIACYLICHLAREQGTTVLLSGQGADEIFAGYPRYWANASLGWLDVVPQPARYPLALAARQLPGALPGQLGAATRRLRRVLSVAHHSRDQRFLDLCTATPEEEIRRVLSPQFQNEIGSQPATAECMQRIRASRHNGIDRYLERDQRAYLPNHNLLYTDKMSMAVGVEARVPLLDEDIVELANHLPHASKLHRVETKVALRDAARGIVPDEIIYRKKAGFGVPYRTWLRRDLAEMWNDLTSEASIRSRGWFDYAAVQEARERSQAGHADLYTLQWTILTFELWARQFLDQNPAESGRTIWRAQLDVLLLLLLRLMLVLRLANAL